MSDLALVVLATVPDPAAADAVRRALAGMGAAAGARAAELLPLVTHPAKAEWLRHFLGNADAQAAGPLASALLGEVRLAALDAILAAARRLGPPAAGDDTERSLLLRNGELRWRMQRPGRRPRRYPRPARCAAAVACPARSRGRPAAYGGGVGGVGGPAGRGATVRRRLPAALPALRRLLGLPATCGVAVGKIVRQAPELRASIVRHLDSGNWRQRACAVQACGELADEAAQAAVTAALSDPQPDVRAAAADAAGRLQLRTAEPVLRRLDADDPYWFVRRPANDGLTRLAGREPEHWW